MRKHPPSCKQNFGLFQYRTVRLTTTACCIERQNVATTNSYNSRTSSSSIPNRLQPCIEIEISISYMGISSGPWTDMMTVRSTSFVKMLFFQIFSTRYCILRSVKIWEVGSTQKTNKNPRYSFHSTPVVVVVYIGQDRILIPNYKYYYTVCSVYSGGLSFFAGGRRLLAGSFT